MIMIKAGIPTAIIPGSPNSKVERDITAGPAAKPKLPPSENMLIPKPFF